MIEQVLNRRFVRDQLRDLRAALERGVEPAGEADREAEVLPEGAPPDAAGAPDAGSVDAEDLAAAREALAAAEAAIATSGQPGFDEIPGDRRRGEEPPPIDDLSFFSRDPALSNLQSALEAYVEEKAPDRVEVVREEARDDRRDGSAPAAVTDRRLAGVPARPREPDGRRLFDKFSVTDVRWLASAVAMGVRAARKRHPFNPRPATPRPISDRCRLVLAGDWASGLPRARAVAARMRAEIEQGRREGRDVQVIHLGDVYYSGWAREIRRRMLDPWPVAASEAGEIGSWSTNGNHDMYSGGHAYFRTLLGDPRFAGHEGSSFFSLESPHWRILGLDTAWSDHDLAEPQPEWVREQVAAARQAGQKVMLLSHHQLFSLYDGQGDKLAAALAGVLEPPGIDAWFWGHEHRCVLYKPHRNVRQARCLGHGGVPVYQWRRQSEPVIEPGSYEFRWAFRKGLERWAYFGFAVLDLDGPRIGVRYVEENGLEHHREVLS